MAKFGRFDPRNKKKNRNKKRSIDKDIRIKDSPRIKKEVNNALKHALEQDVEVK